MTELQMAELQMTELQMTELQMEDLKIQAASKIEKKKGPGLRATEVMQKIRKFS